jgi:hypothetical protein
MNVLIAGVAFWLLTLVALARLIIIGRSGQRVTRVRALFWIVLMAAAVLLYFRPHEDIFGGQDGGAYLNFGARLAREPHLSWQDQLLSKVPTDTREQFLLYGFNRPYLSKFACGRIKDFDQSIVTVWFQPAYPIVMSVPARLGSPRFVLFVIPLFTLLAAFALRAVASLLIPHRWSGHIAFCLYLLNPLVLWHGRAPRPEIIASFLLFAGAALLLNAWLAGRWEKCADLVLGAVCISLAPFFHITAWMLSLPAAFLVLIVILSGREDFLLFPLIQTAALAAFAGQTLNITDTYSLRNYFVLLFDHRWTCALVFVSGLVALAACSIAVRRWRERRMECARVPSAWAGRAAAFLVMTAYAVCYFVAIQNPPSKENQFTRYLYRTDLAAVLNMISLPIGLLGLAGLAVLAVQPSPRRNERWAILLFGVPATLMIGNLYDFFMTRYTIVALMPMLALGLTALVTLIPTGKPWGKSAALACATGIILLGLHGRTQLARITEYRGLTRYLKSFAEVVKQDDGILLFEYSRLAAPFEHLFGVPTLGIPNERINDYSRIEKAWETILRAHPNRPAFFMTPFQPPISDRFCFIPVNEKTFWGERLAPKRWDLPTETTEWDVALKMYRMELMDEKARCETDAFPFCEVMDSGNPGLRNMLQARTKPWRLEGISAGPTNPVIVKVSSSARELLFFVLADPTNARLSMTATAGSVSLRTNMVHLANDWWLGRIEAGSFPSADAIVLSPEESVLISDVLAIDNKGATSLFQSMNAGKIARPMALFGTRWAAANSQFCLPIPKTGEGLVCAFLLVPDEVGTDVELNVGAEGSWRPAVRVPTGKWLWCVWPLENSGIPPGHQWLNIRSDKPFNPADNGTPNNMVSLIGYLIVVD